MSRLGFVLLAITLTLSTAQAEVSAPGIHVVTSNSLNVRLTASTSGKVVDKLRRGSKIQVKEVREGWARISGFYDGSAHGIDGKVSRWVSAQYLESYAPVSQPDTKTGVAAISQGVSEKTTRSTEPQVLIVTSDTLNVRFATNTHGPIARRIHRGQQVEVYEFENGWARISEYGDGTTRPDTALWVFAQHLAEPQAASASAPAPEKDSSVTSAKAGNRARNAYGTPGQTYVVRTGTLNVRLATNTYGRIARRLHRGQEVEVYEFRNGWARISGYGEGTGNSATAQWVSADLLARPGASKAFVPKQVDLDSPVAMAIEASEDLDKYQNVFVHVSERLVDAGTCKVSDFLDIGGWWRSFDHKSEPVYYTYCRSPEANERIYVNVATGQTFKDKRITAF